MVSIFLTFFGMAALLVETLFGLPSFPGAEGFGAETPGGRGGRVYVVTNTNSRGAGSLYAALKATGKRIIVFRVSGVIDLHPAGSSDWFMDTANSYFTLAGQTSPGGVTLTSSNGETTVWNYNTSYGDFILRYVRVRAPTSNDGYRVVSGSNFIIDHCDFSGGEDECLDISSSRDFTVQWCTIANSSVCGSCQTYGFLMSVTPTTRITLHHNLIANHKYRSGPETHWKDQSPPDNGRIDYRNNVCYNSWHQIGYLFIHLGGSSIHLNVAGNYFKAGPMTDPLTGGGIEIDAGVQDYSHDNVWKSMNGGTITSGIGEANRASSPWPAPAVTTHAALQAYDTVLAKVGAWPRDPMNVRTVNEVRTGTGGWGKQDDPLITSGPAAPADADLDGMPDCWEAYMGLNPGDSSDSRGDLDGDGYTNVEEYVNDLALILEGKVPHNCNLSGGCPTGVEAVQTGRKGVSMTMSPTVLTGAGSIHISLAGNAGTAGQIRITDVLGRTRVSFPARSELIWDGKDRDGVFLPSGMYVIQWKSDVGHAIQKRIIIVP